MLNLSLLEKIIDKAIKEKVFPERLLELNTGITLPRFYSREIIFTWKIRCIIKDSMLIRKRFLT